MQTSKLDALLLSSKIIDITPTVSEKMGVFPGDQKFERNVSLSFNNGDNLTLSSINTTVHLGAHTDAPNHYHQKGVGIDQRSLDFYLGSCQVIEVNLSKNQRIYPKDLPEKIQAKRVLLKTNSFPDPNHFNTDFNACSKELIDFLAKKGVILIGIDTPSIDLCDDKELISHNSVFENDLAILEGIILKDVDEGIYNLLCLPLKIKDADASPVRCILIKE